MSMTREQFEKWYAEQSGFSLKKLRAMGYVAVVCECGQADCHGWMMQGDPAKAAENVARVAGECFAKFMNERARRLADKHAEIIADLIVEAAQLASEQHWRRVEEELPAAGVEVIALRSSTTVYRAKWNGAHWSCFDGAAWVLLAGDFFIPVVAWIPMPTFAEEEKPMSEAKPRG